jgi:hypothetical protein
VTHLFQSFTTKVSALTAAHSSFLRARDLLETELHLESTAFKSQKLQLLRIIEDLTLNVKQNRIDRKLLDDAHVMSQNHEYLQS